jgi:thioredoxin reductase (NADPH)
MDTLLVWLVSLPILVIPFALYLRRVRRREALALEAAAKGELYTEGPRAQHPHIHGNCCIGCGSCAEACPEGDVLALVAGKAAIVNGHGCIGHGLCSDACPVGAIEMVMAAPSVGADLPALSPEYETSIQNMFVIGELGGLALIKNAINQGREVVDEIARRAAGTNGRRPVAGVCDLCVVGAGPGGLSASLRAVQNGLSYVTLEQETIGGTVAKYPRRKLVLTSPVEFPIYGRFNKLELSKESLMQFWETVFRRADLKINTSERVEEVKRDDDGLFTIVTTKDRYRAHFVVLALGRRGTPRKLGIAGEDLPKVMYYLIEAESYTRSDILVVGGGDSAVEAAMGLAHQEGNRVTLSYRRNRFVRLKERNLKRLEEQIAAGKITVLLQSNPLEIRDASVLLNVGGEVREIPNDFVWIFAGGIPPTDFLQKAGVSLGPRDLTPEAGAEARTRASSGSATSGVPGTSKTAAWTQGRPA